jgi:hypothetical protein
VRAPAHAALLDACVLYPAALRDTLLRSASRGIYRCRWSDRILEEARRNLIAGGRLTEDQAQRLADTLRAYFPDAEVRNYTRLIASMTTHPKDRHVVAAAVAGRASVIVTLNLKDFPASYLQPFGIEAQSPDAFLTTLFRRDPMLMIDIVRRQAAAPQRPPVTMAEILENLSAQAPEFARLILECSSAPPD